MAVHNLCLPGAHDSIHGTIGDTHSHTCCQCRHWRRCSWSCCGRRCTHRGGCW